MKRKKNNSENGLITVEAVLSLVPFILVIMGIISFINVFVIHNKIQYAMYQISSELSAYTYVYEALSIRAADKAVQEDADRETTEIDDTIEKTTNFINELSDVSDVATGTQKHLSEGDFSKLEEDWNKFLAEAEAAKNAGGETVESVKVLVSDPMDLMRNLVYFGIEHANAWIKSLLLGAMAENMMPKYLVMDGKRETANAYLLSAGVHKGMDGLDFSEGQLFSDKEHRMIDMVVEYDVSIFLFRLFMKEPKIHVVQRCAVPAWLDGDGVKYTPKAAEEGSK